MCVPRFTTFQNAACLKIRPSRFFIKCKNFNTKIKILKRCLVPIWHQLLQNASVKLLFSEFKIRMRKKLQGFLCLDGRIFLVKTDYCTNPLSCVGSYRNFLTFVLWWWWNFLKLFILTDMNFRSQACTSQSCMTMKNNFSSLKPKLDKVTFLDPMSDTMKFQWVLGFGT